MHISQTNVEILQYGHGICYWFSPVWPCYPNRDNEIKVWNTIENMQIVSYINYFKARSILWKSKKVW